MNLFTVTFITGIFFLGLGLFFASLPAFAAATLRAFGRSKLMAVLFFGGALVWFLYEISLLGAADFGAYKPWLFGIFGLSGLAAFYYIPDFLAVRGFCALVLLSSRVCLDAAYAQPQASRLVLVSGVYMMVILSFYGGAYPYRLRDFATWASQAPLRLRLLGAGLMSYGAALWIIAFNY